VGDMFAKHHDTNTRDMDTFKSESGTQEKSEGWYVKHGGIQH